MQNLGYWGTMDSKEPPVWRANSVICGFFQLRSGLTPLAPALFKGQLYIGDSAGSQAVKGSGKCCRFYYTLPSPWPAAHPSPQCLRCCRSTAHSCHQNPCSAPSALRQSPAMRQRLRSTRVASLPQGGTDSMLQVVLQCFPVGTEGARHQPRPHSHLTFFSGCIPQPSLPFYLTALLQ